MNRGAVERAIRFGLAVGAKVAPLSIFARKNYFYPDLPKGYQISQYEIAGRAGRSHRVPARRSEEGRQPDPRAPRGGRRQVAARGLPRPDRHRPEPRRHAAAGDRHRARHALVAPRRSSTRRRCTRWWCGWASATATCRKARFRCDANVSVRRPGAALRHAPRDQEPQQLRFLQQAIDYEVQWQIDLIEDGGRVEQATVLFDPDTGETRAMRTKEDAHDYRYFPDPDLPPLVIAPDWIERVRGEMPELPSPDGGALPEPLRSAGLRRGDDDAEPGVRRVLRDRARRAWAGQAGGQLDDGRTGAAA
jgi:aspartyl-tRNA(Asn)/glutamyl-tRNA(Gln) amidotransferase subunit B